MAGPHQRLPALDALRGIAALLVCLFHWQAVGPLTENPLIDEAWLFVDFFFVLSGFVIAHSYGGRLAAGLPLGHFAGLRFLRLYPLHLVMLGLFVAAELAGLLFFEGTMRRPPFEGPYAPEDLLLSFAMLQGMGLSDQLSWNHPSWSIATEIWVYLLFALAVLALGPRHLIAVGLTVLGAAAALLLLTDRGLAVTYDHGLIRCLYGFGIGVLGHAWWRTHGAPADRLASPSRSLAEAAGLIGLLIAVVLLADGRQSLLLAPLFLGVVLLFAGEGGAVSRTLRTRVPLFLGTISYGIYMVHIFVQARLEDTLRLIARIGGPALAVPRGNGMALGRTPLEGTLLTLLMLALVIAAAHVAYRTIEAPGIRWSKRLFSLREPAPGA